MPCLEIEKDVYSLIYGGNVKINEFWVALIEKAYAKLHLSYQSLESGLTYSAVKDLTGFFIKNLALKFFKPDDFFVTINSFIMRKELISCSKWGKPDKNNENIGLKENLNYKILNCMELEDSECKNQHKSHRLLLIQDPVSSKFEGTWGKNSKKFKKNEKKLKELSIEIKENNFLLRFKEFREFFDEIYAFCKPRKELKIFTVDDEWNKSNSGGPPITTDEKSLKNWLKNPKYFFQIAKKVQGKTTIWVELSQLDPRLLKKGLFPFNDELKYLFFMVTKHGDMKKRKLEK